MPALVSALNSVDLPTLGKPTMPHWRLMESFELVKRRAPRGSTLVPRVAGFTTPGTHAHSGPPRRACRRQLRFPHLRAVVEIAGAAGTAARLAGAGARQARTGAGHARFRRCFRRAAFLRVPGSRAAIGVDCGIVVDRTIARCRAAFPAEPDVDRFARPGPDDPRRRRASDPRKGRHSRT